MLCWLQLQALQTAVAVKKTELKQLSAEHSTLSAKARALDRLLATAGGKQAECGHHAHAARGGGAFWHQGHFAWWVGPHNCMVLELGVTDQVRGSPMRVSQGYKIGHGGGGGGVVCAVYITAPSSVTTPSTTTASLLMNTKAVALI